MFLGGLNLLFYTYKSFLRKTRSGTLWGERSDAITCNFPCTGGQKYFFFDFAQSTPKVHNIGSNDDSERATHTYFN